MATKPSSVRSSCHVPLTSLLGGGGGLLTGEEEEEELSHTVAQTEELLLHFNTQNNPNTVHRVRYDAPSNGH